MSFPKKGKSFPRKGSGHRNAGMQDQRCRLSAELAAALHRELGNTHAAIKTTARWTGASERTVKNWFAGKYGPCGEHLVDLVRHSDEVLGTFLSLAGRRQLLASLRWAEVRALLAELLTAMDEEATRGAGKKG